MTAPGAGEIIFSRPSLGLMNQGEKAHSNALAGENLENKLGGLGNVRLPYIQRIVASMPH